MLPPFVSTNQSTCDPTLLIPRRRFLFRGAREQLRRIIPESGFHEWTGEQAVR
jgi:hypothetical protein